jgi:hypothetical protein
MLPVRIQGGAERGQVLLQGRPDANYVFRFVRLHMSRDCDRSIVSKLISYHP